MRKWYTCPFCDKKILMYEKNAYSKGIFFICKNCKKEIEILIENKSLN